MPEPERLEFDVFEACSSTAARVNHVNNTMHRSIRNSGKRRLSRRRGYRHASRLCDNSAQERTTLRKVEILGLQRLSPDQVIATSGLKVGELIDASIVDAAVG